MRSTKPAKGGFTLLELLIAVALAGIVLTVAYQFFNFVERGGKAAVETSKASNTITPLFYLLLKDLESVNGAYGPLTARRDLDGNVTQITYYTENCYFFKGVCQVKLWILKKEEKPLFLVRSERPINALTATPWKDSFISGKVSSIDLLAPSTDGWKEVNVARGGLIKLILKIKGEGELPLTFKLRT
ncbi:PulJ/GspJ family protein [Thermovibrio ammonificans]|uniref:Prepilin-type N-terminal cleavage/methylation domain-containing protein n=1 Tax=Thermovibrio ammonificans (strain DSM 15698 / JCM 12110 / HB-1) TaxID=648996 RepID=E8T4U8_THEA1|nr:prepilin-type N-terminal cleavage/methylation domain-containing protein [Thermovibrio ammonificans]ADU96360.1 hypothetical protein Theam_0387 [Thermovibrio ammonificans HB-1]